MLPEKVTKGDKIAILAPSSGISKLFPHRLLHAKDFLERKGFEVELFHTTQSIDAYDNAGPKEKRANEINEAFERGDIDAIICAIGGYSANELLPLLDYETIKENPTFFCGYSDITSLHYAIYTQTGLTTYYGPAAISEIGEHPEMIEYTWNHLKKAMQHEVGEIKPSQQWTDELLDWGEKEDLERPRKMKANKGYRCLQPGEAEGDIIGGCLPCILQARGTMYDASYKDNILFIELPEGEEPGTKTDLSQARRYLFDLKNSNVYRNINGLIIGRNYQYSDEDNQKFYESVKESVNADIPILANVDIGHTDPQITVPIGQSVRIDSKTRIFEFL